MNTINAAEASEIKLQGTFEIALNPLSPEPELREILHNLTEQIIRDLNAKLQNTRSWDDTSGSDTVVIEVEVKGKTENGKTSGEVGVKVKIKF